MKNKKVIIIVSMVLIILIILAVIFYFAFIHGKSLIISEDGKFYSTAKEDLIEHLKSIEESELRKNQIDFFLEHNAITQEEAESLY
mgnify:CR=1 FL=1